VGERTGDEERIDTFWAVFFLDRVISSGAGRPVTLKDDDFELQRKVHSYFLVRFVYGRKPE
jgi:hypothetical protein